MPISKIIAKIDQEAKEKAERILGEARSKVDQTLKEAKKEAEYARARILEKAKQEGLAKRRGIVSLASSEARKLVLAEKQAIIQEVYQSALENLKEMSIEDYRRYFKKMLLGLCESGDETIILSPQDSERITPEFIQEVNRQIAGGKGKPRKILKGSIWGEKGGLSISDETRPMAGGFVLKRGKVEIDNSFDSLVRFVREQTEPEVIAILFG